MCRGRDTNRFTLCVASPLTDPRMYPRGRTKILASWMRHVASPSPRGRFSNRVRHVRRFWNPMWAVTTAAQAECAMCVASCPHVAHPSNSTVRHAMCVASHTHDPCVFPSGKNMVFNALHAERRRARPGCGGEHGGTDRPSPGRTPALRASTTVSKKNSESHSHLSPSITHSLPVHSHVRCEVEQVVEIRYVRDRSPSHRKMKFSMKYIDDHSWEPLDA